MKSFLFLFLLALVSAPSFGQTPVSLSNTPQITEAYQLVDNLELTNEAEVREMIGYPEIARKAGLEGEVEVWVTFDEQGKPVEFNIIKNAHSVLDDAVSKQVMKLRAKPWTVDGKPSKVIGKFIVEFKLL